MAALRAACANPPPLDGAVDGCGRCFSDSDIASLGGDPATVPDDVVRRFAEEDPWHWTEEQYGTLWRRLAPQIVALLADPASHADPGLLLRALGTQHAHAAEWPEHERVALFNALSAVLTVALTDGRPAVSVVNLLGGLAHIHDDIQPWFAQLDALTGSAADAGIVRLACHWAVDLLWGYEPFWWWYPDDPVGLVTGWLCSPAVRTRIADFAVAHSRCKNAADALVALDALAADGRSPWICPDYGWHVIPQTGRAELVVLTTPNLMPDP